MNGNLKMTPGGAVYAVQGSDLELLPAVMTDGSGNLIGSVDQGNGTAAVLATQIGGPVETVYSEAPTARTASGYIDALKSGPAVTGMQALFLGVNVTAAGAGSLVVSVQQQDANGAWQTIASTAAITATVACSVSVGVGTANQSMLNGGPYRLSWVLTGAFTFQMSLQGR